MEQHYKRAQNVIFTEKRTVQPVGRDYTPVGFARMTESETRVEADAAPTARIARSSGDPALLRVNGRPPREKDNKDRAGCTDPNPLSPEPLGVSPAGASF